MAVSRGSREDDEIELSRQSRKIRACGAEKKRQKTRPNDCVDAVSRVIDGKGKYRRWWNGCE
jgi:hypothetical protein